MWSQSCTAMSFWAKHSLESQVTPPTDGCDYVGSSSRVDVGSAQHAPAWRQSLRLTARPASKCDQALVAMLSSFIDNHDTDKRQLSNPSLIRLTWMLHMQTGLTVDMPCILLWHPTQHLYTQYICSDDTAKSPKADDSTTWQRTQ